MKSFAKFRSVQDLKKEVEKTKTLIYAIEAQVVSTSELLDFTKARNDPGYAKFKKYLEINHSQINQLYELGFIALFSNFESFMAEFLKDLFKRYPASFQSEKTISFEEIKDFEKISEVRDYFIDYLATEKSYDIDTWLNFLNIKYKIKIFKNDKETKIFKALNSLRNILLHSGGKTNSKFRNEMKNFIKTPVPLGEKVNLDRKKYFEILYTALKHIIVAIET